MRRLTFVLAALAIGQLACSQSFPAMPGDGFVVDKANMLSSSTRSQIDRISASAKRDVQAPIVVVTIASLSSMNAGAMSIESYATQLFDHWQIGARALNHGILLLVSRSDRKARIELGAGWGHSKDAESSAIMSGRIIPRFKSGDYDGGILAGVNALDGLARGQTSAESPSTPWSGASSTVYDSSDSISSSDIGSKAFVALLCPGFFILMLIIGVASSIRNPGLRRYRGSGYNPLMNNTTSSTSFFDSGSFGGGGGFDSGGSSGGGGASGSW